MHKRISVGELMRRGEAALQTGPFGTQLKADEYVDEGVPVINVRNVGFGDVRDDDLEFVTEAKAEQLHHHRLLPDDIVFGRKGAVERHGLISEAQRGWVQGSDCLRLRLKSERVDVRYLSYYLRTRAHGDWMHALCSFGATMASLNQDIVARITFPAPAIEVQRKIAAILSAYDDLIANNQRRIVLLEGMAEEIYREWFVRMRFPGAAVVEVENGIPSGWSLVPTIEAFKYHGGATPAKDVPRYWNEGSVHWYTPTDITGAEGMFIEASSERCTEEGLESCSATLFPAYTVMMTSRATIGAMGINLEPACTNQGFIACVPNERYPLPFLYHWLKLAKPHFELLSGGSTFPELTKGTFKRIKVLTPPSSLMQRFDATVKPLFAQIETLIRANRRLKETRDALLPRLISGKLKVDHLDIGLPPSMRAEAEAVA